MPSTLQGQRVLDGHTSGTISPQAISGLPSSARYCTSGDAANVYGIGWIEASRAYSVSFESDIPLATAVARMNLSGNTTSISYGTPNVDRTTTTAGTSALFVGGKGAAGCYRYKVEIRLNGLSTTSASPTQPLTAAGAAARPNVAQPQAIVGTPSSATYCVSGTDSGANVHDIGHVPSGGRIALTFASDFDAIAGAMLVDAAAQQATGWINDNGGGGGAPSLVMTTPFAGTLALFVGGVNGAAGCYRYKVEIR